MTRLLALLALALPVALAAQTTTVSGTLQTANPAVPPNAPGNYVTFSLVNCGRNTPTVNGVAVMIAQPAVFYPDANGNLTAAANGGTAPSLYGNDQISCGGSFTSRYAVQFYVEGQPQGPVKYYYVSSMQPFNLTTALPITILPPIPPAYPNLTSCSPGAYVIGTNPDLSVKCASLPSAASNAVITNPAANQYVAQPPGSDFLPNTLAGIKIVDGFTNQNIQSAINAAGNTGAVLIPPTYAQTDAWLNPNHLLALDARNKTLSVTSLNGAINAAMIPAADIGAAITLAPSLCLPGIDCKVFVPAGNYQFNTTVKMPGSVNFTLVLDAGATLTYTGSGDAVLFPLLAGEKLGIEGGAIVGNAAAQNGVHFQAGGGYFLDHVRITGFTNGNAVRSDGANTVDLFNDFVTANQVGVYLTSAPGYSSNAWHIVGGRISGNTQWGIVSANANAPATTNQNNLIEGVDLEQNGTGPNCTSTTLCGAILAGWDTGLQIKGNYFEGSPAPIWIGDPPAGSPGAGPGGREQGVTVEGNYFTSAAVSPNLITLSGLIFDTVIEHNAINGTGSGCAVNIQLQPEGYEQRTYLGPNSWSNAYTPSGVTNTLCEQGAAVPQPSPLVDQSYWYGLGNMPGGLAPTNTGLATGGDVTSSTLHAGAGYFGQIQAGGGINYLGVGSVSEVDLGGGPGATNTRLVREPAGPPLPTVNFCTPSFHFGDLWVNYGDGTAAALWICTSDKVAPGGGLGGNANDGNGTWEPLGNH